MAPRRVAKLSTSPKVTFFSQPVPYYVISDQCLKGDRWTTLFLRNSIVAMDLLSLRTHKTWNIMSGEAYVGRNLLASTHLLLYKFKYIKLLQVKSLTVSEIIILGNFYAFQKFCKKSAKFIPSKTCFMVIGNFMLNPV